MRLLGGPTDYPFASGGLFEASRRLSSMTKLLFVKRKVVVLKSDIPSSSESWPNPLGLLAYALLLVRM